jgi:hypothetical protein
VAGITKDSDEQRNPFRNAIDRVAFRLRVAPGKRYLVDGTGSPFLVHGDTAWSILVSETLDGARDYLDDRAARGVNAVIVNLIEHLFAPQPPQTVDGIEPFLESGNLATPNDVYFDHVTDFLQLAVDRGVVVFLAPAYLGYKRPAVPGFGGQPEGWYAELLANGVERCRSYGRYLGRRFGSTPNIVWVMAGDRRPGAAIEHIRAIVAGLREAGAAEQLMTAHVEPEFSPVEEFEDDNWLELNQTYSYEIVHRHLRADYERAPTRPFVLFESTYEGEHNASPLQIRRQAWWAITSGACGQFLGTYPVWLMPPGWRDSLNSPGAIAMSHLVALVRPRRWWQLVPDFEHRLLVDGVGEHRGLDYCSAALSADGRLGLAYLPSTRPIKIESSLLPETFQATWIDPATGVNVDGGLHFRSGLLSLGPPFQDDAVLLMEAVGPSASA